MTRDEKPTPAVSSPSVQLHVDLPRRWKDELKTAARANGVTTSGLVRILIRDFLRTQQARG